MSEYDDEFDEAAYDDDLRAQNAVDDAKYESPEQDEPPEGYCDVVRAEDDDEEDYGAGHTGELYTPAAESTHSVSWRGFPWPGSNEAPF